RFSTSRNTRSTRVKCRTISANAHGIGANFPGQSVNSCGHASHVASCPSHSAGILHPISIAVIPLCVYHPHRHSERSGPIFSPAPPSGASGRAVEESRQPISVFLLSASSAPLRYLPSFFPSVRPSSPSSHLRNNGSYASILLSLKNGQFLRVSSLFPGSHSTTSISSFSCAASAITTPNGSATNEFPQNSSPASPFAGFPSNPTRFTTAT